MLLLLMMVVVVVGYGCMECRYRVLTTTGGNQQSEAELWTGNNSSPGRQAERMINTF